MYLFLAMLASGSLVLFTLISQRYLPYDTGFGFQTHRPCSLGFQKKKGGSEGKYKLPSVAQTEQAMPGLHGGAHSSLHT